MPVAVTPPPHDSPVQPARCGPWRNWAVPLRWGRQVMRNTRDIFRVLDLTRYRPMPAGLVGLEHPWVTGREPESGEWIWPRNVIFQTPRSTKLSAAPADEAILRATGRFLARRVRQSAVTPEIPLGPLRRMPHAINYMHGASHYNSGIVLLNDIAEGYRHFTDPDFRGEVRRFVAREQREVLIIFREREYSNREYAYFSCCLRLTYAWFCNPNGPRGNVLWGNFSPYPAANLITGAWARDVYGLLKPGGAEAVIRPPIRRENYFQKIAGVRGRIGADWPERLLARINHQRIRLRGARGGLRFVDRRLIYADQIERRLRCVGEDRPLGEWT